MNRFLVVVFSVFLLSSCASPLKKGENLFNDPKSAYVIVALKGNMPIGEARYCGFMCSAWYNFGDETTNGVHVFPVSTDSTFEINYLYSRGYSVRFEGKKIEIKKPGVYYFGVIESRDNRLRYSSRPNPEIINKVKDKYGNEIASLNAIGFNWPTN